MEKKHVVCASSSPFFSEAISTCLQACPEVAFPVEVVPLKPGYAVKCSGQYDMVVVVLLDLEDVMGARQLLSFLRDRKPDLRTAVLLYNGRAEDLLRYFSPGFSLIMTEKEDFTSIARNLSRLCNASEADIRPGLLSVGECYPTPSSTLSKALTNRERKVLHLYSRGKTSKEISYEMGISVLTVAAFRRNIYMKVGINSIPQLVAYAVANNFDGILV